MRILFRLLSFPFVLIISFLGLLMAWIRFNRDFLMYGGEMIVNAKDHSEKTIGDVMNYLKKS